MGTLFAQPAMLNIFSPDNASLEDIARFVMFVADQKKDQSSLQAGLEFLKEHIHCSDGDKRKLISNLGASIDDQEWREAANKAGSVSGRSLNKPHRKRLQKLLVTMADLDIQTSKSRNSPPKAQPSSGFSKVIAKTKSNSSHISATSKDQKEKGLIHNWTAPAPDCWFGPWDDGTMPVEAARAVLKTMPLIKDISILERLNFCALELSMLSGQHPDILTRSILHARSASNIDLGLPKLVNGRNGNWTLSIPVLNLDTFAKQPSSTDINISRNVRLTLPLEVSQTLQLLLTDSAKLTQSLLTSALEHKILQSRKKLMKKWRRDIHPGIRASAFPGVFHKTYFAQQHDIPLLQLITGQHFGCSAFSLNYLSFAMKEIQKTYERAVREVYPDRWTFPSSGIDMDIRVGAPLSAKCNDGFPTIISAIKSIRPKRKPSKQANKNDWLRYHNRLSSYTAFMLLAQIGHRGNKHFSDLSLAQIDWEEGLVLFEDKAASANGLRRIAALSSEFMNDLLFYIRHLKNMAEINTGKTKAQSSLRRQVEKVCAGETGLFFYLDRAGTIAPWSAVQQWKQSIGDEFPVNAFRHILAMKLRRSGPQALFAEAQLGHYHGIDLFGPTSPLSVKDFALPVRQKLSFLFYPEHTITKSKWDNAPVLPNSASLTPAGIMAALSKEKNCDRVRIYGANDGEERAPKVPRTDSPVEKALHKVIPGYHCDNPPRGVIIKRQCVKALVKEIGKHASGNRSQRLNKLLAIRLRLLRLTHNWQLEPGYGAEIKPEAPFPVYHAHLQARMWRRSLIEWLTTKAETTTTTEKLSAAVLSFLTYGVIGNDTELLDLVSNPDRLKMLDNKTIGFETHDFGEALAWQGAPACYLIAATAAYSGLPSKPENFGHMLYSYMPDFLRGRYGQHFLINLMNVLLMANAIDRPGLLQSGLTGVITTRHLPLRRLATLLKPTMIPHGYATSGDSKARSPNTAILMGAMREEREQFRTLRRLLDNPAEAAISENMSIAASGRRSHAFRAKAIATWIERANLLPVTRLFANWSIKLLGHQANLRNGGKLALKTVNDYLGRAFHPMAHVFADTDFAALEPNELAEALHSAVAGRSLADSSLVWQALERLFDECATEAGLPCAQHLFSGTDKNPKTAIHADVILPKEYEKLTDLLRDWADRQGHTPAAAQSLAAMHDFAVLQHQFGLRRGEITGLAGRDILSVNGKTRLLIRNNAHRKLKTRASNRQMDIARAVIDKLQQPITALHDSISEQDLSVLSAALRHSTGEESSSLHLFRHTIANDLLLSTFGDENPDPMKRFEQLHHGRRLLGHSDISTTLSSYGHLNQFICARQSANLPVLHNDKNMARFMGIRHDFWRKTKSRYGTRMSLKAFCGKAGIEPYETGASQYSPLTPDMPAINHRHENTTLDKGRRLFLSLCAGKLPTEADRICSDRTYVQAFLTQCQKLARRTGWSPIPGPTLDNMKASLAQAVFIEGDKSNTSQSEACTYLENWTHCSHLQSEKLPNALSVLALNAAAIRWQSAGNHLDLVAPDVTATDLKSALDQIGCDLNVIPSPNSAGDLRLLPNRRTGQRLQRRIPRLLVFASLVEHGMIQDNYRQGGPS